MKRDATLPNVQRYEVGEHFYSDLHPIKFTYLSKHGYKIKTEVLLTIAGRGANLIAGRVTKVTIIKKP